MFLLAVIGFQLGSGAEAYFVKMFGDLIDSWPQTALTIPAFMLAAAFARGSFVRIPPPRERVGHLA